MENIVENYGLSHIALEIFGYLDFESLANATEVKTTWRNLIGSDTKLYQKLSLNVIKEFPECQYLLKSKNIRFTNRVERIETAIKLVEFYAFVAKYRKIEILKKSI